MEELVSFHATHEALPSMLQWVERQLSKQHVKRNTKNMILLTLEEALVNVVNHAYGKKEGHVELGCIFEPKNHLFEFIIIDRGEPFNPLDYNKVDLTSSLEDRQPGGLGIYLIKQIAASLDYERKGDRNILKIRAFA